MLFTNRRSRSFSFLSVKTSICFCMLFSSLTFSFSPAFSYPTGSSAPQEFQQHMATLAPNVVVRGEIEKTFTYYPFRVE